MINRSGACEGDGWDMIREDGRVDARLPECDLRPRYAVLVHWDVESAPPERYELCDPCTGALRALLDGRGEASVGEPHYEVRAIGQPTRSTTRGS